MNGWLAQAHHFGLRQLQLRYCSNKILTCSSSTVVNSRLELDTSCAFIEGAFGWVKSSAEDRSSKF